MPNLAHGDDLGEGLSIGPYDLQAPVGSGGMGRVWVARHRPSSSRVAIKVLTSVAATNQGILRAFRAEIRACAGLNHPSIVKILDRGEVPQSLEEATGGQIRARTPYFVMEYVAGGSLGPWCGQLSWPEIRSVLLGLLDALAHAHSRGLIHRDLKPENVLLTRDRSEVKLTDFGLVHAVERATPGSHDRGLAGTPRYMAPEQLMHRDHIGARTDIYALGCIFYAMLTGSPPFVEGSDFEILNCHVKEPPKPIQEHLPELTDTRMAALIAQMLRKNYGKRPESMDEVRERLQEAILELMAAGVPGAEYVPRTVEEAASVQTGEFAAVLSAHPLRMTQVISRIRLAAPDSPSAALLAALPSVGALQGEVLCLALWGIIQQDLMDAKLDSSLFEQTTDQLLLLLQAVLESHDGSRPSQTQARVFRSLKNLLQLLPKERRRHISRALRPLAGNPLFPGSLVPGENTGSWSSIKAVLGAEITLPGLRRRALDPEEAAAREAEQGRLSQLSLTDKLKQDLSLASLRAVLTHDITLFGNTATEDVAPLDDELPSQEDGPDE